MGGADFEDLVHLDQVNKYHDGEDDAGFDSANSFSSEGRASMEKK